MSAVAATDRRRRPRRRPHQGLRHRRHRGPRPRRRRPSTFAGRPLHRDHGPVGLGQVDADALPRRARHAHLRSGVHRRRRPRPLLNDKRAHPAAPRADRLRVPGVQPVPDAHRARRTSRCRCDLAGRKPDPAWLDAGDRHRRPRRPADAPPVASCRAASSSASPSPGPSPAGPQIIFADEPTGNLDSRAGAEILGFMRQAVDDLGQTIVMVTHDPVRRQLRRRASCSSPTAASSTDLDRPDRRSRCSTASRPSETDAMFTPDPQGPLGPQAPAASAPCLAVFLGVAFLAGTLVLGDTLRANFDDLFTEANAGTDAVVRSATSIDADDGEPARSTRPRRRRRCVDRGRAASTAWPRRRRRSRATASCSARDGERHRRQRAAAAWPATGSTTRRSTRTASSRAGRPQAADEVVINRGAAKDGDLHVGDTTIVQTPEPVDGDASSASPPSATPTASGRRRSPRSPCRRPSATSPAAPTRRRSILVHGDGGVSQDELVGRLAAGLPPGTEAITGDGAHRRRTSTTSTPRSSTSLDRRSCTVFAGVALLVGAFSIFNTFSILVAQRTRESALLRALGASRRQVVRLGRARGARSSASWRRSPGLGGGIAVAGLLKAMFDAFGFALPAGGLTITTTSLIVPLVVGTARDASAPASAPAVRASRVPPAGRHARRRRRPHRRLRRPGRRRARPARRRRRPHAASAPSAAAGLAAGRPRRAAHHRRCRRLRPGRRPRRQRRHRGAGAPAPRRDRRAGPRERHAQPAAHGGHGVGPDGRGRRRHAVHRVRGVAQGVDRRRRRALVRRRPRSPTGTFGGGASARGWPPTSAALPEVRRRRRPRPGRGPHRRPGRSRSPSPTRPRSPQVLDLDVTTGALADLGAGDIAVSSERADRPLDRRQRGAGHVHRRHHRRAHASAPSTTRTTSPAAVRAAPRGVGAPRRAGPRRHRLRRAAPTACRIADGDGRRRAR